MKRRDFLAGMAAAPLATASALGQGSATAPQAPAAARQRTRIRQSVMASVWGQGSKLSFEERCKILARIGFKGVDLPTPEQVPILKQYGLAPAMMTGAGTSFQDGLIRKELHGKFEEAFHAGIDTCAAVGMSQPDRDAGRAPRHAARRSGRQRRRDPESRQRLCGAEGRHALHGDHQLPRSSPISGPIRSSIVSTGASTCVGR